MLHALEHMAGNEDRQLSALAIVNDDGALIGSLNILRLSELVVKFTAKMVEMSVKEYLESTGQLVDSSTAPHIKLSSPMTEVVTLTLFLVLECPHQPARISSHNL